MLCFKHGRCLYAYSLNSYRHVEYIIELQKNGNTDKVQFLLSYTGNLEELIEVIISMSTKSLIKFRVKTFEEKAREYLATNWQDVLSEVHDKVEKNNPIEDAYIERMLLKLKPYDRNTVENLMAVHERYKANR